MKYSDTYLHRWYPVVPASLSDMFHLTHGWTHSIINCHNVLNVAITETGYHVSLKTMLLLHVGLLSAFGLKQHQ